MLNKSTPPNILWLVTDHQAYANHRLRDENQIVRPAFDWVARKGITFTKAYSVCPICTPARASMLTGVYPHHHEMTANAGRFGARIEFDPDQKLISHYLRAVGYRCGYFGKWHCGEERTALDYDFEGFTLPGYGYPYKSKNYADYLENLGLSMPYIRMEDLPKKFLGKRRLPVNKGNWFDSVAGSAVLEGPMETHEAFFISHLASEWLEQQIGSTQPFFLRIDVWGPHPPYVVSEPFVNTVDTKWIPPYPNIFSDLEHRPQHHRDYRDYWTRTLSFDWLQWQKQLARCYEHIMLVDTALSKILAVIERTDLMQNTVIIYTADHGDALGSNGGVANKGALMVEETTRIPLTIYCPGLSRPGAECRQLVSNMDLVPTVLELAGADRPSRVDGRSLTSLLIDPETQKWSDALMLEHYGLCSPQFQRMLRWKNYKYVVQQDGFEEVYDLEIDPYEMNNLALNPGREVLLPKLRSILRSEMATVEDNSKKAKALLSTIKHKQEINGI